MRGAKDTAGGMKVTVMFGRTGVVVPCREGWTVKDLIQQATQRYRKLLEQLVLELSHLFLEPARLLLRGLFIDFESFHLSPEGR
ncbi:hypothetical protein CRUP_002684 [Coryphaenoides rupestris]|nr:hypothetical protein CRUP_002684 [Coryphaenoides rupestris]